jgi:hypothetical protein
MGLGKVEPFERPDWFSTFFVPRATRATADDEQDLKAEGNIPIGFLLRQEDGNSHMLLPGMLQFGRLDWSAFSYIHIELPCSSDPSHAKTRI